MKYLLIYILSTGTPEFAPVVRVFDTRMECVHQVWALPKSAQVINQCGGYANL